MRILLDGCSTLEQRFATIDSKRATEALQKSQENADRVSPKMKKLTRRPDFQQKNKQPACEHGKLTTNRPLRA